MIKTAVIGHPVAHSKSPTIHNYWFEKYGIAGLYESIDIAPDMLRAGVEDLMAQGYAGFNVTIPHKESIMALCDELDETAIKIGAVNTVTMQNGRVLGANTDAFGFIENIKQQHPGISFKNKTALVLGAGGAAKAIIYGLLKNDIERVIVTNRTTEKAQHLAQHFTNLEVVGWGEKEVSLCESDLLINATSLGMSDAPALDLDLTSLKNAALVCDIVYAPLMTNLLQNAQQNGHNIVTGIGMLLHQARPGFKRWGGVLPDIDDTLIEKVRA